eukprot:scaffold12294_cov53-Phaeocystis_antarctica.AAC.3
MWGAACLDTPRAALRRATLAALRPAVACGTPSLVARRTHAACTIRRTAARRRIPFRPCRHSSRSRG